MGSRPGFWFGEDQGRYILTVPTRSIDVVSERSRSADISLWYLGLTGGDTLAIAGERPLRVSDLKRRFENWLPAYMAGESHL
jgi:phosphoribosylformylglycinamidine synthase